jgi:hypothetical protein
MTNPEIKCYADPDALEVWHVDLEFEGDNAKSNEGAVFVGHHSEERAKDWAALQAAMFCPDKQALNMPGHEPRTAREAMIHTLVTTVVAIWARARRNATIISKAMGQPGVIDESLAMSAASEVNGSMMALVEKYTSEFELLRQGALPFPDTTNERAEEILAAGENIVVTNDLGRPDAPDKIEARKQAELDDAIARGLIDPGATDEIKL